MTEQPIGGCSTDGVEVLAGESRESDDKTALRLLMESLKSALFNEDGEPTELLHALFVLQHGRQPVQKKRKVATDCAQKAEVQHAAVDEREEKEPKPRHVPDKNEAGGRGRGRPPRQIEGFTFSDVRAGHSKYVCAKCGARCDARATGNHRC